MKSHAFAASVLAMLVCVCAGCKNESGPGSVKADLSTPKAAATTFIKAMLAGDTTTMRSATEGTDEQFKVVEAMGSVAKGMVDVRNAAKEKFGENNAMANTMSEEDPLKEIEAAEFKTEGDVATMIKKDGSTVKEPMKLKKVGGDWKVDLSSMPTSNSQEVMKMAPTMKKTMEELAADIRAGKFKTAEEAKAEMGKRMMAAAMSAMPAPPNKQDE